MRFRYSGIAPDVGDVENATGRRPGHRFEIAEKDGGIIIQMLDPEDHQNPDKFKGIFVGYEEAEEIVEGLQEAITLAKSKGSDRHSGRVRDKTVG